MKLAPIKALSRRSKVEKLDSCPKKRDAGLPAVNSITLSAEGRRRSRAPLAA